ncbi:MAG: GNAT family N-acetyltransferase [Phycisphaerales bacterium JB050]
MTRPGAPSPVPAAAEELLGALPVMLEPLSVAHAPALVACADQTTFRWFPTRPDSVGTDGVGPVTVDAMERFLAGYLAGADRRGFAIVDRHTGRVVACSSYLDVRPAHRGLEIGSTWIAPDRRGTQTNPAMKLAMLTMAFETDVFGAGSVERGSAIRVQLKTHHENLASRRAIEKIGAVFEGVLRNHMVMPDGSVRHTVMYAITPEDWPAVKAGLLARLEM